MNSLDFEYFVELNLNEKKTITAFKLWLLSIATSFNVKETGRTFKSEYVISQLLMLACKDYRLYGVSYYSKKVKDDRFANHVCVSLAIFASYDDEPRISKVCKDIKITKPMNFEMFKNLLPSLNNRYTDLNVTDSDYRINIGNFERQYPYAETEFYNFDRYLVFHLEEELKSINMDEVNS